MAGNELVGVVLFYSFYEFQACHAVSVFVAPGKEELVAVSAAF